MKIKEKTKKAIQDQDKIKATKKYEYVAEDTPLISKQKEIFNKLVDERLEKLTDWDKNVNSDDLKFRHKGNTPDLNFHEFDNALALIGKIRDGEIGLTDVKHNQKKFKSYLGESEE